MPGGWLTITVLLLLVVVAVVVGVRVARGTMRTNRGRHTLLFGSQEMSAAEHRSTAEHCAARGDWAAAIRHRLRAVARHLEETAVVDPVPGRTATELARDAGPGHPRLGSRIPKRRSCIQRRHLWRPPRNRARLPHGRRPRRAPPGPCHTWHRTGFRTSAYRRLGRRAMTDTTSAVGSSLVRRWRTLRWVLLALVVIVGTSAVGAYSDVGTARWPDGSRGDVRRRCACARHAARGSGRRRGRGRRHRRRRASCSAGLATLVAPTPYLIDDDGLRRLAGLPGNVLLVEPLSYTREALAPKVKTAPKASFGGEPDCDLREATRAGSVQLDLSDTYEADRRRSRDSPAVTATPWSDTPTPDEPSPSSGPPTS